MAKKAKSKNLGLTSLRKDLTATSKGFLGSIQKELVQEEQEAFKDFVKGTYRLKLEKEKAIEALQKEVELIDEALGQAEKGNWEALSALKIPARFFNESVLRKHGKSLISGTEEVRFMDLYVEEE